MKSIWRQLFVVVFALATAGCGATNEEFARFANAGTTYADSVPSVYSYSVEQYAKSQMETITKGERQLAARATASNPADREKQLETLARTVFEGVENYRSNLDIAKEHASVLRSYFITLAGLASDVEATKAGENAAAFATKLGGISDAAGKLTFTVPSTIPGVTSTPIDVAKFIEPLVARAVAAYKNERLREHLKKNAKTVSDAIAIQEAILKALREIETRQTFEAQRVTTRENLIASYMKYRDKLPDDWVDKAVKNTTAIPAASPITQAQAAAKGLRESFDNLLLGRSSPLDQLEQSVALVNVIIKAFEAARQEK